MLEVNGQNIGSLPFGELKFINELMDFDGMPVLVHYLDEKDKDILAYWVDYNEKGNRWLYFKIDKDEFYKYLSGGISLKELLSGIRADYVFLQDIDLNGVATNVIMLNSYKLPEKYLPKDDSYYTFGIDEYYERYLHEFTYIDRLRRRSYIIKVEPKNRIHDNATIAKDAAFVLNSYAKSMENYIDVTAFDLYTSKKISGDRTAINKKINALKRKLSPVITNAAFGSFEVWLSMDVVSLEAESKYEVEWRNSLVENYKNDVLDVDVSSEDDAKLIAEKYTPEQRKKIFDPIIKVLENEDIDVTVSNYNRSLKRDYRVKGMSKAFKDIIIPKPTVDELLQIEEQKDRLIHAVIRLRGGKDVSKAAPRDIKQNILFTDEKVTTYPIDSVEIKNAVIRFKKPILCELSISDNNENIVVSNSKLDLYSEAPELRDALEDIKQQLIEMIEEIQLGKTTTENKYSILKSLL